jgi:hypothetical protein
MFRDLDLKKATKRAALFTGVWLLLIYVLSVWQPGTFGLGLDTRAGQFGLALNALLFFAVYTFVVAFTERRRRRVLAERNGKQPKPAKTAKASAKADADDEGDEEAEPSLLKGRHNPNTSRKKATRRRR